MFPITARDRKTRDKRQETGRQAGRQQADAHGRGRDGDAQVTLVAGREGGREQKIRALSLPLSPTQWMMRGRRPEGGREGLLPPLSPLARTKKEVEELKRRASLAE